MDSESRSAGLTRAELTRLRVAAALCHAVPGLGIRVRHDGEALVDIGWWGGPPAGRAPRWLPPCAFRAAIAEASERIGAGSGMALLGLPPEARLGVELLGGHDHPARPGIPGLVGAYVAGRATWVVATTAPPGAVATAVEEVRRGAGGRIDVLHDDVVSVALVAVERSPGEWGGDRSAGRNLATELLVACCLAELDDELAAELAC